MQPLNFHPELTIHHLKTAIVANEAHHLKINKNLQILLVY